MTITYNVIHRGNFYEVWDSFADWIDTFDSEADALACIAFLEDNDQIVRQAHRSVTD